MKPHKIREKWCRPYHVSDKLWFYRERGGIDVVNLSGESIVRVSARFLERYVDELRTIRRIEKGKK